VHFLLTGQRRQFLSLFGVGAERPFAVDVLARFQGVLREHIVRRHAHGHQRGFDLGVRVHRFVVAIGPRHAVLVGRCLPPCPRARLQTA